jgi:hypothetical protein
MLKIGGIVREFLDNSNIDSHFVLQVLVSRYQGIAMPVLKADASGDALTII